MAKPTRSHICPHLGLKSDPTTALHFASVGNYCHHANPPEVVKEAHQTAYCLVAEHTACPVYKMAAGSRLPRKFRANAAAKERKKIQIGTLPIVIGAVLLVLGAFVILQLNNPNGIFSTRIEPSPTVGSEVVIVTRTPMPSQEAFQPFCQPPPSWNLYLVGRNDTFTTLSIKYARPAKELMDANCRSSVTDLTAGERIYMPALPTATPTPTATVTKTPTPTTRIIRTRPPDLLPTWTGTFEIIPFTPTPTNTPTPTDTPIPTETVDLGTPLPTLPTP
jgi:hypothetical protein